MASTRTQSSPAKRVSLTQDQRGQCGSTTGGHASLISFARSASSRTPGTVEFGSPSHIGVASPGSFRVTPPQNATPEFERATASAIEAERKRNREAQSRKREHPNVPKRMREPMTVEVLTGMMHELPCPSAADDTTGTPIVDESLSEQMACMEVQKRRRQCDSIGMNSGEQVRNENQGMHTNGIEGDDDMTDDLCFLVDQVAIQETEKETKFMPYCL